MFKMNKKYVVCSLLLGMTSLNAMNINKAVQMAVDNHPSVKVAEQEVLVNEQKIKIAKSAFYPKVDLKVNYGDEDKKSKANAATSYTKENFDGGYHAEVVATQNIFNGYADSANVDKNQALHQSSEFKKVSNIDKLSHDVIKTYLEIVRLREVLKYEENSIKKFEEYYSLAAKKSNVTGQKSETHTVNSKLLKTKSDHIKNKWNLKKQTEKFVQLVGIKPESQMSIDVLTNIQKTSLSDFLNGLEVNNSELNELLSKLKAKKYEQKEKRAGFMPKLDFELKSYEDEDLESYQSKVKQTSAMLNLTFNLFNGGKDSASVEQMRLEQLKLQNEYEKKNIEQIETIKTQFELYKTSKEQIKTLGEYVKVQEELTYLYQEEFKLGKRTIINLVDSQQDLKNAHINYINSFIDMVKSSYAIVYASGGLYDSLQKSNLERVALLSKSIKKKLKGNVLKKKVIRNKEPYSQLKGSKYTLSLATFFNPNNAQKFVQTYFPKQNNIYTFKIKDTIYIKVLAGAFNTKEEALRALNSLPKKLVKQNNMSVEKVQKYARHLS